MSLFPLPRVIFIMAISNMFELGLVAGFRDGSIQSQEKPAVRSRSFQFVPSIGIQDSKELNKTCCLNGGTCILGSFCACPASFYGRNCEHDVQKENCGSVSHGAWLPKKCSLCKCWHGQFRCFPQAFISGCGKRVLSFALSGCSVAHGVLSLPGVFSYILAC
uniref:EGF-like domain-containing protein n=1 Tax=Ictidomys tridecemlineatus TaxID=43179 RepID=I3MCP1_ICTTR